MVIFKADSTINTAEQMAIAVLKGDWDAARQLADLLTEHVDGNTNVIPPVKKLTCTIDKIRVVLFADDPDADFDRETTEAAVAAWLRGERVLALRGIDRVELYEIGR